MWSSLALSFCHFFFASGVSFCFLRPVEFFSIACAGYIRHGREPGGMDGFVLHFALLFLFDRLFLYDLVLGPQEACEGEEGGVCVLYMTGGSAVQRRVHCVGVLMH